MKLKVKLSVVDDLGTEIRVSEDIDPDLWLDAQREGTFDQMRLDVAGELWARIDMIAPNLRSLWVGESDQPHPAEVLRAIRAQSEGDQQ